MKNQHYIAAGILLLALHCNNPLTKALGLAEEEVNTAEFMLRGALLDRAIAPTSTSSGVNCFNCHIENTETGRKVAWAQMGWGSSVHANGIRVPILDAVYAAADPGNCYSYGSNTCWRIAGYEWEGTDAYYANGGGCQVCHTQEGYLKKINGGYGGVSYTNLANAHNATGVSTDGITNPSPLSCFGCHQPHTKGSFDLVVPQGTAITTEGGAVYDKNKGNICASCHVSRLGGRTSPNLSIIATLQSSGGWNQRTGPHHGPQTDTLLGASGAIWSGNTYINSTGHGPEAKDAHCQSCHYASDFEEMDEDLRYSASPAVGGHSFAVTGIVHGAPAANRTGCTASGCHVKATVTATTESTTDGWRRKGMAYVKKTTTGTTSDTVRSVVNELLKKLANPGTSCTGLLTQAVANVGGGITWTKLPDGTTDPKCLPAGKTGTVKFDSSSYSTDSTNPATLGDANNQKLNFTKAYWNFMLVAIEDRSFGYHNYPYLAAVLYDSCIALKTIVDGGSAGATAHCTVAGYTR